MISACRATYFDFNIHVIYATPPLILRLRARADEAFMLAAVTPTGHYALRLCHHTRYIAAIHYASLRHTPFEVMPRRARAASLKITSAMMRRYTTAYAALC